MKDLTGLGAAMNSEVAKRTYEEGLSPTVREVGQMSAEIVKAFRWFTVPFAYVGAYRERIEPWLEGIRDSVPDERKIESPPEIAGPALEAMRFRATESTCGQMFQELLKTSIDADKQKLVHPGFPKLIEQMSTEEALVFQCLCRADEDIATQISLNIEIDPEAVKRASTSFWLTMNGDSKVWIVSALYFPNGPNPHQGGCFRPFSSMEIDAELFVIYERLAQIGLCRETQASDWDGWKLPINNDDEIYCNLEYLPEINWYSKLHVTAFGHQFADACNLAGLDHKTDAQRVRIMSSSETESRLEELAANEQKRREIQKAKSEAKKSKKQKKTED